MDIRKFRWEDLPALVDLMNEHAEAFDRPNHVTLEQVEKRWRAPYNHPDENAFVAQEADGHIIGYTIADLMDEPHYAIGVYQVLPGNPEAGRALMQAATNCFMEAALANSAPDVSIMMDWHLSPLDTEAIALCGEQGFQQVRQFYTMRMPLDHPIPTAALPPGFSRRPFTPHDLDKVFDAKVEIFRDHWGGQHDSFDEWRSDINQAGFDPDLWWVIYAEDEIAGMVLSQPSNQEIGWVGIVGVRRAWRKRGLAQTMLLQCFAEYQRRGFHYVQLGVDSNSPTKAVALYERVGMHIQNTVLYYRHILRDT